MPKLLYCDNIVITKAAEDNKYKNVTDDDPKEFVSIDCSNAANMVISNLKDSLKEITSFQPIRNDGNYAFIDDEDIGDIDEEDCGKPACKKSRIDFSNGHNVHNHTFSFEF